ncbi:dihydrolipoyl dehydrogenase family protein [Amaricoccus macauensis]|uniref:dihydrolipoyl dehydrogenase family protein n=1 Tax=Amaricoccus macauensis TaxID=57001 RepID=UPI003C7E8D79
MSRELKVDLCVIGAGSGGLSVAAGAVQMGASVVLIEAGEMGGDCLNYGCVPSKALLAAGKHARAMSSGAEFGVAPVAPEVNFAAAKEHVDRVIAGIAPHDSQERFEGLGVTVLREHARFVSDRVVEAGEVRVTARRFVIATGSRPGVPPISGLGDVDYFTNETIFGLQDRPEHLLVLGGGAIGLEMAQAHLRLGSRVTVIEAAELLGREDPDLREFVLSGLRKEGVAFREGAAASNVRHEGEGIIVTLDGGEEIRGSHLLVAAGRQPNIDDLGLEAAGIRSTKAGIEVDAGLRSSNRRVYAIGDVAGQGQFTHLAGAHAGLVVRSALFGLPVKATGLVVPRVLYTEPELAQVGLTEREAREAHGDAIEVLTADYEGNDRARTDGLTEGRIKVIVHKGKPVGAGIVGAQAGELIGLWTLAIGSKTKISTIAGMVLPYPTLSEVSKRAAGSYYTPRLFENPMVKRIVRLVQRLP